MNMNIGFANLKPAFTLHMHHAIVNAVDVGDNYC